MTSNFIKVVSGLIFMTWIHYVGTRQRRRGLTDTHDFLTFCTGH